MHIEFFRFDHGYLIGDSAMHPIAPRLGVPGRVAPPCGQEPAASSRLARHAARSTLARIQLRFLGSIQTLQPCGGRGRLTA